jgi:hypothetical protein
MSSSFQVESVLFQLGLAVAVIIIIIITSSSSCKEVGSTGVEDFLQLFTLEYPIAPCANFGLNLQTCLCCLLLTLLACF